MEMNNILLSREWVKTKIKTEIKDLLKFNENEYTAYPNLWNTKKSVLTGMSIALST